MRDTTMVTFLTIDLKYVVLEFSFNAYLHFLNYLSKYQLGSQAILDQIRYLNSI